MARSFHPSSKEVVVVLAKDNAILERIAEMRMEGLDRREERRSCGACIHLGPRWLPACEEAEGEAKACGDFMPRAFFILCGPAEGGGSHGD